MPTLKTRKPSCIVPWPLVLVEGPEKSGKTWAALEFSGSDRIGAAYALDLGEGSLDEYGSIPGANYDILEHDGTWADIMDRVLAVREEGQKAMTAGDKPVLLVIDSMTAEWEMHKDWIGGRARMSHAGKRTLQRDPNAEVKPTMNLWNDANDRHARLMRVLMTFPGIVVMTARGKQVSQLDDKGQPIPGSKEHKVEGQKSIGYDSSAWVRLSRDESPIVVGLRSVHAGIQPGVDKAKPAPNFSLEWLVFDALKCDPATAQPRQLRQLEAVTAEDRAEADAATQQESQGRPEAAQRTSTADRARSAVDAATRPPAQDDLAVRYEAERIRDAIKDATTKPEMTAAWGAIKGTPQRIGEELAANWKARLVVLKPHLAALEEADTEAAATPDDAAPTSGDATVAATAEVQTQLGATPIDEDATPVAA